MVYVAAINRKGKNDTEIKKKGREKIKRHRILTTLMTTSIQPKKPNNKKFNVNTLWG